MPAVRGCSAGSPQALANTVTDGTAFSMQYLLPLKT